MFLTAALLVIASGFMNALWNFGAKTSCHKGAFLACITLPSAVVLMPGFVAEFAATPFPAEAYIWFPASVCVQCLYSALLAAAYRCGDLSQTHPIMRGTGVVLIPLGGMLFLHEWLDAWGWMGVVCIAGGVALLGVPVRSASGGRMSVKPVAFALLVGLCITAYTLIDKLALRYASPLFVLELSNIGFLLAQLPHLLNKQLVREEWMRNRTFILLGSLFVPGSYWLFLLAMDMTFVSHIAPIREISIVFTSLLGIAVLREGRAWLRLASSAAIVIGIILLGIGNGT